MIKHVMNSLATAARSLLRNGRIMAALFGLHLALLIALYLFSAMPEANLWQDLLTLILALVAPVLFFALQAMSVGDTQNGTKLGVLLGRSLGECWKLMLISVPMVLLAWLIVYFLGQFDTHTLGAVRDAARLAPTAPRSSARAAQPPGSWLGVVITALRFLLLGMVLPLAAIHLWIATAREGLGRAIKGVARIVAHSFAPSAVLTYAIGLVIFGIIPYFLIFMRISVGNWWVEIGLLSVRLTLAFVFIVFGWVVTLGALSQEEIRDGAKTAEIKPTI